MKISVFICVFLWSSISLFGQILDKTGQQESWNKRVFSIENFINKFNGNIDLNNESINDEEEGKNQRIQSILYLINDEEQELYKDSTKAFVLASIGKDGKRIISLSDQNCYAEVTFSSILNGQTEIVKGYFSFYSSKDQTQYWSMEGMVCDALDSYRGNNDLLHFPPNSHGNDFASIPVQLNSKIKSITGQKDSKILQKIVEGKLKIDRVTNVTYHFFQVKDWYFKVNEFSKKNQLSGWLIGKIKYMPEQEKVAEKEKIISILTSL